MRRFKRYLFTFFSALSLLLCIGVCVLWVRSRNVSDELVWTYDRYLADKSAATTGVYLTSDKKAAWLLICWGHVGPYNGQLVWGYYMNADQSGGRPRWRILHYRYAPGPFGYSGDGSAGTSGLGPLRWKTASRSPPKDGDHFRSIRIGLSHWLLALILLVPPSLWINRLRKSRRARRLKLKLCLNCGYDLRATPPDSQCPECGLSATTSAT